MITEQQQSASNIATMETAGAGQKAPLFGQTDPANELEAYRFATPSARNNATAITSQLGANLGFIDAVQPSGAGGNTIEAYSVGP